MSDRVSRTTDPREFWIRERCYIREIVNTDKIPDFSLCETRVEAGVTTELHSLEVKEWYIMLRGSGLMEVGGEPAFEVGPGDIVEIPAGVSQRITNTSDSDLVLQCVCIPRFYPDSYKPLEGDDGAFRD